MKLGRKRKKTPAWRWMVVLVVQNAYALNASELYK